VSYPPRVRWLLLAACSAPAAPISSHATPQRDSTGLPDAYASLFHDAATNLPLVWTDTATHDVRTATARCEVSGSHAVGARWVTSVACGGDDAGLLADGFAYTFVATTAGLWRNVRDSDDIDGEPILTAPVHASRHLDDEQRSISIVPRAGGWCIVDGWHDGTSPVEMTKTLCVREGAGIVGGAVVDPRPGGFVIRFGDSP
jgi:hypothetical protein